jgi:ammonium transporter, Amt family
MSVFSAPVRTFLIALLVLSFSSLGFSGLGFSGLGFAQSTDPTLTNQTVPELAVSVAKSQVALNIVWVMLSAFLVMFMQAGFALAEAGFTRAKNAGHTIMTNLMVYGVGVIGFWAIGFALQMGGSGGSSLLGANAGAISEGLAREIGVTINGSLYGLFGASGFGLAGAAYNIPTFALFFFHMALMGTALAIPTGALSERWKFSAFMIYALVASSLIYPVFANWAWGGGWLSSLPFGHGFVDFAGSGVVHLTGAVMALTGSLVLGPRIGKFGRDGTTRTIPAHNQVLGVLGVMILGFGWFGLSAGSTLSGNDLRLVTVAVSAMLASASGMIGATLYGWALDGKPNLSRAAFGLLAGLVASSAGGAYFGAPTALLVGLIGGLLFVWTSDQLEQRFHIDDPMSAIAVHGVCGIWGLLAVGLFADGTYGTGLHGVDGGVTGLLYGNATQILAQLSGIGANIVWVGLTSFVLFKSIDLGIGMRVRPNQELEGLDYHELGMPAYSDPLLEGELRVLHPGSNPTIVQGRVPVGK